MKRMKPLIVVAMALVICQRAYSQDSSPLHQYMATHSLVARPTVFRDLQNNLSDALGTKEKGAQLSVLYSSFSDVRSRVSAALQFSAKVDGNNILIEYRKGTSTQRVTVEVPAVDAEGIFQRLEDRLAESLSPVLADAFSGTKLNLRVTIIASLMDILASTPYADGVSVSEAGTPDALAHLIAGIVRKQVQKQMTPLLVEGEAMVRTFRKTVVDQINTWSGQVNEIVATAFDQAEAKVREAVSEFSQVLVSANSGLAVTKGEGQFAGGLQLTFWTNKSLQFGVYFARQQSNADTTLKAKSLVGFRVLLASGNAELAFMGAVSQREAVKEKSTTELGGGLAYRASSDLILRAEGYFLVDGIGKDFQIWGLSVQGTRSGSPSLFVGYATGSKNLVYQVSFPILSQGVID